MTAEEIWKKSISANCVVQLH